MTRKSMILMAAGAVALLLVWFLLLWQPKGRELADARARSEQATMTLDQLQLRLARLQALSERRGELDVELARLRQAVPDHAGVASFLLDTDAAAKAAGVEFLSVSPQEPQVGDGASFVAVSMDISGGYHQVLDFLDRLMEMPRVVVIDSITATPGSTDALTSPPLTVSLGGRMFTTAAPAAPTDATTPTSTVVASG